MALDVDAAAVTGTWWRHIPHSGDPWYRPSDPPDGRWQRGSAVEALYLADSPKTVWAEWYRLLAEYALRPSIYLPRDLWRWRVKLGNVADLSTPERLERVGLTIPPPGRGSWPAFQPIGEEELHREGWTALIAPSAARPENGRVMCCFRTGSLVEGVVPIPPPRIVDEPPVPPRGLRT